VTAPPCDHAACVPRYDPLAAQVMTPAEVAERFPRFDGVCPGCACRVVVYASLAHRAALADAASGR
jgi:hypothetical protein